MNFTDKNIHLASFPEKNPNPVVEFLLSGEITYSNPAAKKYFPDLHEQKLNHVIFSSVRKFIDENDASNISTHVNEIRYKQQIFELKFNYHEESGIARMYCHDISAYKINEERLAQLALFPMQNPNPVIEVDYENGAITFMNPAAQTQFPAMREADVNHPLFSEIRKKLKDKKDFVCEINIAPKLFEQKVFFIADSSLARIYLHDLTERKRNEKNLPFSFSCFDNYRNMAASQQFFTNHCSGRVSLPYCLQ